MTKTILTSLGIVLAALALFFFAIILYPLFGALAGWVVSFVFDDTIKSILLQLGIKAELWQLGAFLGFVGGFFRTTITQKAQK